MTLLSASLSALVAKPRQTAGRGAGKGGWSQGTRTWKQLRPTLGAGGRTDQCVRLQGAHACSTLPSNFNYTREIKDKIKNFKTVTFEP